MWKTIVNLRNLSNEDIERVLEKCSDINDKDSSFKFGVKKNYLIIESETRNQAFRRGTWLISKFEELKDLNYNVVVE